MPDKQERPATLLDGPWLLARSAQSYYAEVVAPSHAAQIATIERLIEFAFGDLKAQHLELRVVEQRACGAGGAAFCG